MFAWGRRCGGGRGIAESISEITHWRVLPSLTARGSVVHPKHIQYTDRSGHTVKEWKRGQTTAAVCPMSEQHNPHGKLHHHVFLCRFTANKWQFVNLTEKKTAEGDFTQKKSATASSSSSSSSGHLHTEEIITQLKQKAPCCTPHGYRMRNSVANFDL